MQIVRLYTIIDFVLHYRDNGEEGRGGGRGGVEGAGAGGQAGMRDSQQTEEMQEGEQEIPQDGRTYRQTDKSLTELCSLQVVVVLFELVADVSLAHSQLLGHQVD